MSDDKTIFGVNETTFNELVTIIKSVIELSETEDEAMSVLSEQIWGRPANEVFVAGTLFGFMKRSISASPSVIVVTRSTEIENGKDGRIIDVDTSGKTDGKAPSEPSDKDNPADRPADKENPEDRRLSKILVAS